MKKLFIELPFNGRGSLDYARNVAKKFDNPKDDPSSSSSISPRVTSCLNFHHADSKQCSHDEEETQQTHCSCFILAVALLLKYRNFRLFTRIG